MRRRQPARDLLRHRATVTSLSVANSAWPLLASRDASARLAREASLSISESSGRQQAAPRQCDRCRRPPHYTRHQPLGGRRATTHGAHDASSPLCCPSIVALHRCVCLRARWHQRAHLIMLIRSSATAATLHYRVAIHPTRRLRSTQHLSVNGQYIVLRNSNQISLRRTQPLWSYRGSGNAGVTELTYPNISSIFLLCIAYTVRW